MGEAEGQWHEVVEIDLSRRRSRSITADLAKVLAYQGSDDLHGIFPQ